MSERMMFANIQEEKNPESEKMINEEKIDEEIIERIPAILCVLLGIFYLTTGFFFTAFSNETGKGTIFFGFSFFYLFFSFIYFYDYNPISRESQEKMFGKIELNFLSSLMILGMLFLIIGILILLFSNYILTIICSIAIAVSIFLFVKSIKKEKWTFRKVCSNCLLIQAISFMLIFIYLWYIDVHEILQMFFIVIGLIYAIIAGFVKPIGG